MQYNSYLNSNIKISTLFYQSCQPHENVCLYRNAVILLLIYDTPNVARVKNKHVI